jgi:hypothetical protein
VLGEEHPETLRGMNNLATVYLNRRKLAESERLYSRVLEAQRKVLGEQHPDTLTSMGNLAVTFMTQRKFAQAEPLFVSSYEGMAQRAASAPENQRAADEAGRRVVQLYQSWGRADKAAEWTRKLRRAP